jgi:tRNA A-37 threonylcarbamoyl transferase component Bud32
MSGTLPPDFGLHSKLQSFHIATNSFSGKLPENLCYHGELLNLTIYENQLSGELPESLGNCSSLLEVKVYKNEFSGKIPDGLWRAENLLFFMVSHNKFIGELPQKLASRISIFDISYNQFYGGIPIGVSSWTNVVEFIASKNYLNGSIPQELTNISKLETLFLDQNQLKGSLPFDVLSWSSLQMLNLSQNQLDGQIPVSIGHLTKLSVLDLSENQFSGEIPSILPRLTDLNLSSNHLTGRVPSAFDAFDRSFLNNSGLCSDTPALNLTLCNSKSNRQTQSNDSSLSPILIVILVIVSILVASVILFLIIKLYSKRKQGFDNSWKLTSFQRLNFTESDIVSSMTEDNIIGSGGYGTVYRVDIDGLGYVAVKKIWENRKLDNNLEKSFHTEVKILSSIRHRNIVKLLCCISNEDTMLLVYEYVENRSLDRWLQKKKTVKSSTLLSSSIHHAALDWPKRLQIAIGVAQGLSYMHHECSPPVVHRDVKTSNILLDAQFNAKVADFGLARTLINPEELATMSAVIGSFGYMAPGEINGMPNFLFFLITNMFLS